MTSSRVVRGTKGRITLCVCAILIITGIIVCYNNTLSQLDDVRRSQEQCHQQQENLSTQLQVIFDYKQRLEKSLKTEKAEHQQTRKELENRLDEEKSRNEKTSSEASLKLSSLQQQYNMLQAEYDDYKEESGKMQQQQLNEINDLQSKLKEIQGQLKQAISEKDNAFEHLKSQYLHLQVEKENLQKQVKATQGSNFQSESEINHLTKLNHQLQRELDEVKGKHYSSINNEISQEPLKQPETYSLKHLSANFSKQVDIGDSVYQIRDSQNNPVAESKQDAANVADLPSNADGEHIQIGIEPKTEKQSNNNNEAFNNNENVLAAPNSGLMQEMNYKSSSSTTKTSKAVSKASLDAVQPLNLPTVTPDSIKNKPSQESRILNQDPHVLPLPFAHKRLPVGVVPVPKTPIEAGDESKNVAARKTEQEDKDIREEVNNAFPNRYRANLILNELANEDKAIEADKQEQINEIKSTDNNNDIKNNNKEGKTNLLKSDVGDKENNALEVFDPPVNEKEKVLEADPFGLDDLHGGDKINSNNKQTQQKIFKQQVDGGLGLNNGGKLNDGHKAYDGQDGVDYDKDVQNDMQLEENDPEGEDDDPDYADHIAQHKDPAVRN